MLPHLRERRREGPVRYRGGVQASGIPFDLCWRDAGWYPCKGSWPNTGTWELDPQRYPRGFRPFSDWLHQQGKKFIVWFEPERVGDRESWLAQNHPDWLLGGNLLNLGHPDARQWLVEHIDRMLREQGIDYYRQDFNMDPLPNWRGQRRPEPPRHDRDQARHGLPRVLGRTSPPPSRPAD